jgi:phage-related protein
VDQFPEIEAPDWGLADEPEPDIDQTSFGDGYALRRKKGINSSRERWSPVWSTLDTATAKATYDWLKVRQNLTAFWWVHPVRGEPVKVLCTGVRLTYNNYNDEVLTASFLQDFNPA